VLLYEITYARLMGAVRAQGRERGARLITGDAVAATIAHEIKQPLSTIITRAETGLRWLDRTSPELDKAKEQFTEIVANGRRAGAVMDGIRANFKKDPRIRTWLDVNVLIEETLTLCTAICSNTGYWFVRNRMQRYRRSWEIEFSFNKCC